MALILGIDFETSGLDCKADRIIEIGAVLWCTDQLKPMKMLSCFIDHDDLEIPAEITEITGITTEECQKFGISEMDAFMQLYALTQYTQFFMAHHAAFDRGFYEETERRVGNGPRGDMEWICTALDVVYPDSITTRNLKHLAAEHSFLNPFAHRAVFDVLTMLRVSSDYSLARMIERSREPTVYIAAAVSFEQKELAKERGYRWAPKSKTWWRAWKASEYLADKEICGFKTYEMQCAPE